MAMKDLTSHIVTSLIACVVAMMAFWMVEARNYIGRAEVISLIESQSPYSKDKSMIMAEINRATVSNLELKKSVEATNTVLVELKIEMAVLNKTLQQLNDVVKTKETATR